MPTTKPTGLDTGVLSKGNSWSCGSPGKVNYTRFSFYVKGVYRIVYTICILSVPEHMLEKRLLDHPAILPLSQAGGAAGGAEDTEYAVHGFPFVGVQAVSAAVLRLVDLAGGDVANVH